MSSIFDEVVRDRVGPARHDERDFEYLNTSARPMAHRVRTLLDDWLSRYPEVAQKGIRNRMRSRSDVDFASATFELALNEMMIRLGCRVVSVEEPVENGTAPDFLVEDGHGQRFYLEAVIASTMSDNERGSSARLEAAVQALDEVISPGYHLQLSVEGIPSKSVPLKRLRKSLQAWVDRLSGNKQGGWSFEFEGAVFAVKVLAPRFRRNGDARAISVRSYGASSSSPHVAIRNSLLNKAKKYGKLGHPYAIAINAMGVGQDDSDLISALFGTEVMKIPVGPDFIGEPYGSRMPDGLWHDERGPRRRGVSAVLYLDRFSPWVAALRTPILALNPWAQNPLGNSLGVKTASVVNGEIVISDGPTLSDLFELGPEWPGPDG